LAFSVGDGILSHLFSSNGRTWAVDLPEVKIIPAKIYSSTQLA
jgi:hypothetical protein